MKIILDVENTTTKRNGKVHLDPFEPDNSLTLVGMTGKSLIQCLEITYYSVVREALSAWKTVQYATI